MDVGILAMDYSLETSHTMHSPSQATEARNLPSSLKATPVTPAM